MPPPETWRLSRVDVQELLVKYERAVEEDATGLLRPSEKEKAMLGRETIGRRVEAVRRAREVNRRFIDALIDDIPDLCAGPDADAPPSRPVAAVVPPGEGVPTLPASSYGSVAAVLLHLFRDWSEACDHVRSSQYEPVVAELSRLLPGGGTVLLPGAGLGRLALMLAAKGYRVEANDASRLFVTVADFLLNRAPASGFTLYPLAHVFSENYSHDEQYVSIQVPSPRPAEELGKATDPAGEPLVSLIPGDFVKTYGAGAPRHKFFDAIVTCYFIDTVTDVAELFETMDGLLKPGGIWVNIGPLNWRKEARMKLNWDEVKTMWKNLGYTFLTQKSIDCDYHMPRLRKMYTESYNCTLTAAVKGGS